MKKTRMRIVIEIDTTMTRARFDPLLRKSILPDENGGDLFVLSSFGDVVYLATEIVKNKERRIMREKDDASPEAAKCQ